MDPVFAAIEQSPLSIWLREDLFAYFWLLIGHALGMALLAGMGVGLSLRAMGVAGKIPLHAFRVVFPVMWLGLVVAVISGLGLLIGYPAKALTNWVFGVKMSLFIAAGLLTWRMARDAFPKSQRGEVVHTRLIGAAMLAFWLGGVACGKLLLYTHHQLMVSWLQDGFTPFGAVASQLLLMRSDL